MKKLQFTANIDNGAHIFEIFFLIDYLAMQQIDSIHSSDSSFYVSSFSLTMRFIFSLKKKNEWRTCFHLYQHMFHQFRCIFSARLIVILESTLFSYFPQSILERLSKCNVSFASNHPQFLERKMKPFIESRIWQMCYATLSFSSFVCDFPHIFRAIEQWQKPEYNHITSSAQCVYASRINVVRSDSCVYLFC